MKQAMFRKLANVEKRMKLGLALRTKTGGKLDDTQIMQILNRLDIGVQYSVKVTSDPFEYSAWLTLIDKYSGNWSNYDTTVATARPLFDKMYVEYGVSYSYEHDDGHDRRHEEYSSEPNFDVRQVLVNLITTVKKSTYSDISTNTKRDIVIYIPTTVSKDIAYQTMFAPEVVRMFHHSIRDLSILNWLK